MLATTNGLLSSSPVRSVATKPAGFDLRQSRKLSAGFRALHAMENTTMGDRNIFAYTVPGSDFPDYISINRRNDRIVISVRGCRGHPTAEIVLPQEELDKLIYALRGARINPLLGSGDLPARRPNTNEPAYPVPTDSLEKARMKRPRRPQ